MVIYLTERFLGELSWIRYYLVVRSLFLMFYTHHYRVVESKILGYIIDDVDAESFIASVACQLLRGFSKHRVRRRLKNKNNSFV